MNQFPDSGFDRVSFFYDPLARLVFGDAQLQAQKTLLPFIATGNRVLIIGGGSGWILEQLLISSSNLQVVYLDASPNMISLAQERTKPLLENSSSAVDFRTGTEQALQAHEQFDAIMTPFLLDLFPPQRLSDLMQRLSASLTPNGRWLFADFWPVTQPTPLWQKLMLKTMYLFFGVVSGVKATSLPDFEKHFKDLQLREIFAEAFYGNMIQAKVLIRQSA